MVDLVALARTRGLERCALRLAKLDLATVEASLDPLPKQPFDVPTALGLLRRRGAESALVRRLLVWLEGRPLELGLFSWDVLCSAIFEADDASLANELKANAQRVRAVLPAPGSTFANFQSTTSKDSVASIALRKYAEADDDALSHAAIELRSIGALDVLRERHGLETLAEGGIVASTAQFARHFHLCHLSTLGSFYADYALNSLRSRDALPVLVEILLDVGAAESLPPPSVFAPDASAEQLDLLGYAAARAAISSGKGDEVLAQLRAIMKTDYLAAIEEVLRMPRSHVVLADAAAEQNELPVPFEILDQIASADGEWRYAHRVRAVASGLVPQGEASELPLMWTENFLDHFGNDFTHWYESGMVASGRPWRQRLLTRAAAEVAALPHDFMAWAGLAALIDSDGGGLVDEINARVATQCDLTSPN